MSVTRRLMGALPRFSDLMRHLPRGQEIGAQLDDALKRLSGVSRGLPTTHADTHRPTTGADPLVTGTPLDIGTANVAGSSDDFARGAHSHRLGVITTKGDLIGHNGTDPTRLGVGANGDALVADSTEALGFKWGTPAAVEDAMLLAWVAVAMTGD